MDAIDITGRWNLIEIEYPPIEPGEDDGGFADEGMGTLSDAGAVGLGSAFLQLSEGGTFTGSYWGDESGAWRIEGGRAIAKVNGEDVELTIRDGVLERPDFDEEHGRRMIVRYERVVAAAKKDDGKKLTKKVQKLIDQIWDLICECDCIDEPKLRKALEEGGQAAATYLQSRESGRWVLSSAINNDNWALARLMLEHGADPNVYELDETLVQCAEKRFGHTKDPEAQLTIALLREKGAR